MLSRIDLRGRTLGTAELRRTLPRGAADVDSVVDTVRPVVEAIAHSLVEVGRRDDDDDDDDQSADDPGESPHVSSLGVDAPFRSDDGWRIVRRDDDSTRLVLGSITWRSGP